MRTPRFLTGVFAAVLSVALVGGVPAHAVAAADDPLATTVTGACSGGHGRVALTVHPPADGRHRVEVTARGLAEGSRWIVQVEQADDAGGGPQEFRRVAIDGRWKVLTRFQASTDSKDDLFFILDARERGDRGHRCSVLNFHASPIAGLADCNNRRLDIVLISRERDDGSTAVRSIIFNVRPDSRWHLTLTATAADGRQVVDFHDRADRREGVVDSRVVFTGVQDPRLRMVASNKDQRRCFIGLDPPAATTDAPPTLKGLDRVRALTS